MLANRLAVKQPLVDMALNASGIRDTARVFHVRPTTVLNALKKGPCTPTGASRAVSDLAPRADRGGKMAVGRA
jgi:hypothetical protein